MKYKIERPSNNLAKFSRSILQPTHNMEIAFQAIHLCPKCNCKWYSFIFYHLKNCNYILILKGKPHNKNHNYPSFV